MDFPYFNSKELTDGKSYTLTNPKQRKEYFHAKLGHKIDEVKEYLEHNAFIGYMLAKKQGGKGTYAKMLQEILDPDTLIHLSVGDLVRDAHNQVETEDGRRKFISDMTSLYRGVISLDEAVEALIGRSQDKVSVPTELVLAMLRHKINELDGRALLIDGMPRTMDQITYSLYFKDIIDYGNYPDFFLLIDVPEEIISTRIENRVVCPDCHTSKSMILNPTTMVKYDEKNNEYYYICDNKNCSGYGTARYTTKEGDSQGIELIRERLNEDQMLLKKAFGLYGIPKILVRSSYPISDSKNYLEDYEIQPYYEFTGTGDEILSSLKPGVFKDDAGVDSHTVYAATYVVSIFSQLHSILIGNN